MRTLDENDVEVTEIDESLGYVTGEEEIVVAEHEAVEAVEEQGHYEVIAEYPNGGKDVEWVVDVEGVEAQDAWTEYETIQRWHWYTDEELAEIEAEKEAEEKAAEEAEANSVENQLKELQLAVLELASAMFADEEEE